MKQRRYRQAHITPVPPGSWIRKNSDGTGWMPEVLRLQLPQFLRSILIRFGPAGMLWLVVAAAPMPLIGQPPDSLPPQPGQPAAAEPALIESDSAEPNLDEAESLPMPSPDGVEELTETTETSPMDEQVTSPLTIADVIASLYRSYPEIAAARRQPQLAAGLLIEAWGAYDTKLQAYSLSEPLGFYEVYRNGLGAARQTWWGGYVAAGYRIGRGQFQPWYEERETNEGGEYSLALAQPLLQGRAIDPQRVAVFRASLDQQAAQPIIQQAILDSARQAAVAYWDWVANGLVLEAQRELLELAEVRGEQFEAGVKAGKFAEIDLILNQQLIAERRAKVLDSERKYRKAGFKLSLFLRDPAGVPMIPNEDWLLDQFPVTQLPELRSFAEDFSAALAQRPEPQVLRITLRQLDLDRRLASNDLLPRLDVVAKASQDTGKPTSEKRDKSQFEMIVGLQGEVPIQRSKARGKLQSTSVKIAQLRDKLRLQEDKIGAEIQAARNDLLLSEQIVDQAELALRAAVESLDRYRFAFERGKLDLISLNLLETKANETEIELVEAQQAWFIALAGLQAALGLDPLEQAVNVASLPASQRPGPGRLPEPGELDVDAFDQDWQRRNAPQ